MGLHKVVKKNEMAKMGLSSTVWEHSHYAKDMRSLAENTTTQDFAGPTTHLPYPPPPPRFLTPPNIYFGMMLDKIGMSSFINR